MHAVACAIGMVAVWKDKSRQMPPAKKSSCRDRRHTFSTATWSIIRFEIEIHFQWN
jgi:hypothetical protein